MRFWKLICAVSAIILANWPANAAVVETFRLGGWSGSAFTDDATGRFNNCVASAAYRSGITLYVQVDTTYNWAIGFSAPTWNLTPGQKIPLQFRIDRGAWQSGTGTAADKTLVRMPMPDDGYIIKRFRRGRTMYVYDGAYNYEFRLTGTSKLMARLARCVKRNSSRHGVSPSMGSAAAPAQSQSPAQPGSSAAPADPQLAIEATQALFNVLGQAGISGLKLIPDGQREEDLNGLHAVAADEARTVVAHIFAPGTYQSEQELISMIIADSAKSCEGSFSSGSEKLVEGGKDLFTANARCLAGDVELIERAVIVKRSAGGIYVYGVADTYTGEGGGAPLSPPKLTDSTWYSATANASH